MAKVYTTTIESLRGAPSYDSKTNVITAVNFQIVCVDGEYTHNWYGDISVDYNANDFIEFDNLKESDVIAWVEAHPAYTSGKNWLSEFIDNMKVPMDVGLEKPW
jgi:hypothetical protein